jgi:hypothetical protein
MAGMEEMEEMGMGRRETTRQPIGDRDRFCFNEASDRTKKRVGDLVALRICSQQISAQRQDIQALLKLEAHYPV